VGHWTDLDNQRSFYNWVAKELNITKAEDWYNTTAAQVITLGGSGLLYPLNDINDYCIRKQYEHSHIKALMAIYPDIPWQVWKFKQVPRGFWASIDNQRQFFLSIKSELKVINPEDWYKVGIYQVYKLGGRGLLYHFKLEDVYVEESITRDRSSRHYKPVFLR
jgi:hypothetical protein